MPAKAGIQYSVTLRSYSVPHSPASGYWVPACAGTTAGYVYAFPVRAAPLPAMRPKTAPDISPVPPG
jgi:hypothetical protein